MKHGLFKDGSAPPREYWIWVGIKQRCCNPNNWAYPLYGGRGITICNEWVDDYEAFALDMGKPPSEKHSIDRVDNDLGYSKGNCKWSTPKEQANNRRNAIKIDGLTIEEICKLTGMTYSGVYSRYARGWHFDQILETGKIVDGRRKTNRFIEINGVSKTLTEWSRETGLSVNILRKRLKSGYSERRLLERANASKGGCRNHQSKLSMEQVAEIKASGETNVALSKRFGVSNTTISNVRKGRVYAC